MKKYRSDQLPAKPVRAWFYGGTGAGKTFLAGTFPEPLFLSVGLEGGDTTLQASFGDRVFEVWQIDSVSDMRQALSTIQAAARKTPAPWRTIVVDSLTYYADTFINERRKARAPKGLEFEDWALLEIHVVQELMRAFHALPQHVVWICGERNVTDENDGRVLEIVPSLPGKQLYKKCPPLCDVIGYCRQETVVGDKGKRTLQNWLYLQPPSDKIMARTRYRALIPEHRLPNDFAHLGARIGAWIGEPDYQAEGQVAAE